MQHCSEEREAESATSARATKVNRGGIQFGWEVGWRGEDAKVLEGRFPRRRTERWRVQHGSEGRKAEDAASAETTTANFGEIKLGWRGEDARVRGGIKFGWEVGWRGEDAKVLEGRFLRRRTECWRV